MLVKLAASAGRADVAWERTNVVDFWCFNGAGIYSLNMSKPSEEVLFF